MRHRIKGRKLSRNTKQRQALLKSLISHLFVKHQVKTTEAKAKAVKGLIDKLVTKAKKGSLSSRRQVLSFIPDKKVVNQLFDVIAPSIKDRTSGFTRIIRIGRRRGDNAMMAKLELVDKPQPKADKQPKTEQPPADKKSK